MNTDLFNVAYSLKMWVGSRYEKDYGDNYGVTEMCSCGMMWFKCVINHVSSVFLMTHEDWFERSGKAMFVRVLRFTVLIDSNV